jgi:acyl-CoA synthetase (AMP-forming)/AMP-acid ligase II
MTEEEVKAFCRDRIAHFKVPRYVKFTDDWPGGSRDARCYVAAP